MKNANLPRLNEFQQMNPQRWLSLCPSYKPTPLKEYKDLGKALGHTNLLIKDESQRLQLGSFKALGGAYAIFCFAREALFDQLGFSSDIEETYKLSQEYLRNKTVCCASAGNHGLSVAREANLLGIRCEIFISEQVPKNFSDRLQSFGAIVHRAGALYEDSMEAALLQAKSDEVTLITDSSWPGETHYPSLVMEGYSVISEEARLFFETQDHWPTDVILQAGVGGMAAAVTQHIRTTWRYQPKIIIVEPDAAACLSESVSKGLLTKFDGPKSSMGRLDCKVASLLAFDVLKHEANRFITVTDKQAYEAKCLLSRYRIHTTSSGAAGLAGLISCNLQNSARPLIIVTEGHIDE